MDDGVVAFALELVFVFAVMLLLRFSLRLFAFRLLLFAFAPRLANAMSMTIKPTPITTDCGESTEYPPDRIRFFLRGAGGGVGRPLWLLWLRRRRWWRRRRRSRTRRGGGGR